MSSTDRLPIDVVCSDIAYSVPVSGKKGSCKKILSNINVKFRSGKLTAIMGASGAGKTSLLNVISGDISKGSRLTGKIFADNREISAGKMKKISGFVFQDDIILETMTIREAIMMSANLRTPSTISQKEKQALVSELINILGLEDVQDTVIGSSQAKGISGGEKKRTSIAMELVTNPLILFLDEPTSGLDTLTSYTVVNRLKILAEQNRTIVATIHQPSSEIFHLFDDLLLLADGKVVYSGPADESVNYFSKLGYQCPQFTNPADYFFMEVLNAKGRGDNKIMISIDAKNTVNQKLNEEWNNSEEFKMLSSTIQKTIKSDDSNSMALDQAKKIKASSLRQFSYLSRRVVKNVFRNKILLFVRVLRAIFMGLVVGFVYYDIPSHKEYAQIQDRTSALFFLCNNELMSATTSVLFSFDGEKKTFIREYRSDYYGIAPYYLSKIILEMPFSILSPIITVSIAYFLVGFQRKFENFAIAVLINILMSLAGNSLGLFLATLFSNFHTCMAFFPILILPLMIFGGLMINLNNIPVWLKWAPYISPLKYGFTAMSKNELVGLEFKDCNSMMPCTGNDALKQLGLSNQPEILTNMMMLIVITLILLTIGFFGLFRQSRK